MAVSSGYYSYNGHVLPYHEDAYGYNLLGESVIYLKDGTYYFGYVDAVGTKIFQTNRDCDILWFQVGGALWELQDGTWVKIKNVSKGEDMPFDNVVWTSHSIEIYSSFNAIFSDGTFMEASPDPEPIYSDGTLIGVPDSITVSSEGETGIIISAVVKLDDSELDVSISAKFEIIPSGSGYLDENRQLFVNAGYSNLSVQITLDALPGQVATIPVRVIGTGYPTKMTPYLGLTAYFLGRRIVGQRKRMPVAYLYNGVRLPKLPEYDAESKPYAGIYIKNGVYYFYHRTLAITVIANGTTSILGACYKYENDAWVSVASGGLNMTPIWANHDVLYTDSVEGVGGTVFLAASEPVPIYE